MVVKLVRAQCYKILNPDLINSEIYKGDIPRRQHSNICMRFENLSTKNYACNFQHNHVECCRNAIFLLFGACDTLLNAAKPNALI